MTADEATQAARAEFAGREENAGPTDANRAVRTRDGANARQATLRGDA